MSDPEGGTMIPGVAGWYYTAQQVDRIVADRCAPLVDEIERILGNGEAWSSQYAFTVLTKALVAYHAAQGAGRGM